MNQSETIKQLADALCKAQAKMLDAHKDSTNPHFNSRYADLSSVREAVSKPLAEHQLAVTQVMVQRAEPLTFERGFEGKRQAIQCLAFLRTTLMHTSGEWISSELPIVADWGDPQKIGSAITYARRYALAAICGIAQDDDDANAASPQRQREEPRRSYQPEPRRDSAPAHRPPRRYPQDYDPDNTLNHKRDGLDPPPAPKPTPAPTPPRVPPTTGKELLHFANWENETIWFQQKIKAWNYGNRFTTLSPPQVAALYKHWKTTREGVRHLDPVPSPATNGETPGHAIAATNGQTNGTNGHAIGNGYDDAGY